MMKRKYVALLHIIIWTLLLISNLWHSLSVHLFSADKKQLIDLHTFLKYFTIEATYILIPLCCFYSACVVVAPQIILKKNYFKAGLLTLLTLAVAVGLRYISEYHFFLPVFHYDNYRGHPWPMSNFVENVFFYYFPRYFVYGLMYFFAENWYKAKQLHEELQKEKAVAELEFLRSQINPHFLFNSINDIYSLTYHRSELAPSALLKLSDILRYMLREGREDSMPLQSEIKYLENVIELQRISAKGNVNINFTVEGYIGSQKIATLLLIAFVENAFKHGILTDPKNPVQINLLELIYPDKYSLTVDDKTEFYKVDLKLLLL
jgi:two-component system LytT family sensor kinase